MTTPKRPLKRNIAILVGLSSSLAMASLVAADAGQSGANCTGFYGPRDDYDPHYDGITFTPDDEANWFGKVACPLVRENTMNTTGPDDLEMYVIKSNVGPPDNFTCTATSVSVSGMVHDAVTVNATVFGQQKLNFAGNLNVSSAKGAYVIVCQMRALDKVITYWMDEPAP